MSDFIYSSIQRPQGELTNYINSIYHTNSPRVYEFHGLWGSLAVSRNLYTGFQTLETENFIITVIGGPVLYFRDNLFLTGKNQHTGTKSIYNKWISGKIKWDEDLSGPFAILIIDKHLKTINCITDLMMFIPVYQFIQDGIVMLGTHVDSLAKSAKQSGDLDFVSLIDFVLNNVVTYPFTVYKNIRQCPPATSITIAPNGKGFAIENSSQYWVPKEINQYPDINEASDTLREGIQEFVDRTTEGMSKVAQFISAGEDTRVLSGILPRRLKRDGFIFLDSMNREGRIAKKVAKAYQVSFNAQFRKTTHYLEILREANDLIGSGHQYFHAHTLGLHKSCGLDRYTAVFGGYLSDSLLKAPYSRKYRGGSRFPFLPEIFKGGETRSIPIKCTLFPDKLLSLVNQRRNMRLHEIEKIRQLSAHEWFVLWPATMRTAIPNLYSNRRLFRTYEPFMCNHSVKISASVPTDWKLNRRLFNKAMRPHLKVSRWIFHANGRLPYFPWWANMPIHFCVWAWRNLATKTGLIRGNQGSWADWQHIMNSRQWHGQIDYILGKEFKCNEILNIDLEKSFWGDELTPPQKINLLQILTSGPLQN